MSCVIDIKIDDEKLEKIAWDMGRYADDLPDDQEVEDWLKQSIDDLFDNLPKAILPEKEQ